MECRYSIIIPFHDKYDLFVKAINSIPDRDDIQIIIVDNSASFYLSNRVPTKRFAEVNYITSSPTSGAGCARNVGLQYARGRFITFLDADDYFTTETFTAFDRYYELNYDIVYFSADSIRLSDGKRSQRHRNIENRIKTYLVSGNDDLLRYCVFNPVAKLFRTEFIKKTGLLFDEIKVSNDVWFSVMTGHYAERITADSSVVYMITEGEEGRSLTKTISRDNMFTRFEVQVRYNSFLKSVGKYKYHVRLLGALRSAYKYFGSKEFLRYLKYVWEKRVCIF